MNDHDLCNEILRKYYKINKINIYRKSAKKLPHNMKLGFCGKKYILYLFSIKPNCTITCFKFTISKDYSIFYHFLFLIAALWKLYSCL